MLAFSLRTIGIVQVPIGLHNDEVFEIKLAESVVSGLRASSFHHL
jgi:hypothetical protein